VNGAPGTLLLGRAEVAGLLDLGECIAAVEEAFRRHGEGRALGPASLGVPSRGGGFHVKAAGLDLSRPYFAAKVNGNFFDNSARFGLPNIQGVIVLCDAENGYPLAVMDSIEITIARTGAATAVAAKYLARPDSRVATICGCGNQGRIQLRALARVLPIRRVLAYDPDEERSRRFVEEMERELGIPVHPARDLETAVRRSDVCITCTPSRRFFLKERMVSPGTFIAAVGADDPRKQEIEPALLASSKVVADVLAQCAEIGEIHHALEAGLLSRDAVHGELADLVTGRKTGRTGAEEITLFDSTGTALQDVAAAAAVYEKAVIREVGVPFDFFSSRPPRGSIHRDFPSASGC
jgi:alanine dehydrogenase